MQVPQFLEQARDTMTVRRVFGEPMEKDGVTIIPAARVRGGAGGGVGDNADGSGSGGGFGVMASPAGVYVVKGEDVTWQPALDLNKVIIGGQIVAIVLLLVIRSIVKTVARPESE
jgi:uncharacterized spore protein YtfJ